MAESALPIRSLSDLYRRFAAFSVDDPPVRHVRGTALAMAQDWWVRLPDGPAKDAALNLLSEAAKVACEAYEPAG
jgi:hypothetical protein